MLKKKRSIHVHFLDQNITFDSYIAGETLLDLALRNKLDVPFSCGGYGTCGTCRVFVSHSSPQLLPRNEIEQDFAEVRGFEVQERLACQIELSDDLQLTFATKKQFLSD